MQARSIAALLAFALAFAASAHAGDNATKARACLRRGFPHVEGGPYIDDDRSARPNPSSAETNRSDCFVQLVARSIRDRDSLSRETEAGFAKPQSQ